METILKGGTELILGGAGTGSMVIHTVILGIVAVCLIALYIYMIKNPPSTLFGQIAYIIGVIVFVLASLLVSIGGISMMIR